MAKFDSFIFTHIPKCGGTSFRKFVYDAGIDSGLDASSVYVPGFGDIGNDSNLSQLDEPSLTSLQGIEIKILADHSSYNCHKAYKLKVGKPFYYTILRDPVKRFISHYNFFYFHLGYDGCKGLSLDELNSEKLAELLDGLSNVQVKYLSGFDDFGVKERLPMKRLYYIAKFNMQYRFNLIGILEKFDDSLKVLKENAPQWLKLKGEMPLKNVNHHVKKVDVSVEVRAKIREANLYDVNLYEVGVKKLSNQNKIITR